MKGRYYLDKVIINEILSEYRLLLKGDSTRKLYCLELF